MGRARKTKQNKFLLMEAVLSALNIMVALVGINMGDDPFGLCRNPILYRSLSN